MHSVAYRYLGYLLSYAQFFNLYSVYAYIFTLRENRAYILILTGSVADPDPPDPHVFGPPGSRSGSTSQRYGSGSGSFYHRAKIVRKTLIPTIL
jgi:hypothetical protein